MKQGRQAAAGQSPRRLQTCRPLRGAVWWRLLARSRALPKGKHKAAAARQPRSRQERHRGTRIRSGGAGAGLVATAPMTVAMQAMFRLLPKREQYPLPPSWITAELTEKVGLRGGAGRPEHRRLTLVSHFGYGAATGAVWPARRRTSATTHGAAAGNRNGLGANDVECELSGAAAHSRRVASGH